MSVHTLQEDFDHFLAYSNFSRLPEAEKSRLRLAYEHGDRRGREDQADQAVPHVDAASSDLSTCGETDQ